MRQLFFLASIVTMVDYLPPQLSPHTTILATVVQLINKVFVYAMARHFVSAALLIQFILALNVNSSIHPALSRHIFNGKS